MENTTQFINETYDKLTYFDLYGNSIMMFIFYTLIVFIIYSYCKIIQTKETIKNDWAAQRCKPQNMLFAGFIAKSNGKNAFEYTSENFQYCVQNILTNITGATLNPFQYMIQTLTNIFKGFTESIQLTRTAISGLRNGIQTFAEDIFGRILNITMPIQKMIITILDTFQKIQGVMTGSLYTMLGSYYTLQALMGAILDLIIKMLTALTIIIVGLWVMPFTWPAAAASTAVFLSIAVPLAIIIYFMTEVLHIKTASIPKLRCFDKNTTIMLKNGVEMPIMYVEVGDILENGSYVTAKMKVTAVGLQMMRLKEKEKEKEKENECIVSDTHLVKHGNCWIRMWEHPEATKIAEYNEPFVYCLNTSDKKICIGKNVFSDWDEIQLYLPTNKPINFFNMFCENLKRRLKPNKKRNKINKLNKLNKLNLRKIHQEFDDGFSKNLLVDMFESYSKPIQDICIGDILSNGALVYGIVEVGGKQMKKLRKLQHKQFHLLTTNGEFIINGCKVGDYNSLIENSLIEKFII